MEIDRFRELVHPYGKSTPELDGMKSTLELPICSDGELNLPSITHIAEDCSSDSNGTIVSNCTESE